MKLHASRPSGVNTITGYGEGYVMVNGERRASSLVVLADRIEEWSVAGFDALTAEDFQFLKKLDVEIVLLGTGARQRFPHPRLVQPLTDARIGCEAMTSQAACRTYNILMGEGRRVLAAILLDA